MPPSRLRALLAAGVLALAAWRAEAARRRPRVTARATGCEHALKWTAATTVSARRCGSRSIPPHPTGRRSISRSARVQAGDPDQRIGSLAHQPRRSRRTGHGLRRPGGRASCPSAITDRFDIVGWDPRGTGASSSRHCGTSSTTCSTSTPRPTTRPSKTRDAAARAVRAACESGAATCSATSRRSTRCATWIGSARRSERTSSRTRGSRTARTSARSTRSSTRTGSARWSSTVRSIPRCRSTRCRSSRRRDSSTRSTRSSTTARRRSCAFPTTGSRGRVRHAARPGRTGADRGRRRPQAGAHAARHRARRTAVLGRGGLPRLGPRCTTREHGDPTKMLALFDKYVLRESGRHVRGGVAGVPRDLVLGRAGPGPGRGRGAAGARPPGGAGLRRVERRARARVLLLALPAGERGGDSRLGRRTHRRSSSWAPPATRPRRSSGRTVSPSELGCPAHHRRGHHAHVVARRQPVSDDAALTRYLVRLRLPPACTARRERPPGGLAPESPGRAGGNLTGRQISARRNG